MLATESRWSFEGTGLGSLRANRYGPTKITTDSGGVAGMVSR